MAALEVQTLKSLSGGDRAAVLAFLAARGLRYDERCGTTICVYDSGRLVATGSRDGAVLKCIAVEPGRDGEGLAAAVVSALVSDAASDGHFHLMIYTAPDNARLFSALGFYPVAASGDAALLENRRDGAKIYASSLHDPRATGTIGCIVANCNPFTNGHLYLAEQAAKACDFVYFLIVSEDRSLFPADVRLRLATGALSGFGNVAVRPTGPYLVSAATFPDYFIKDQCAAEQVRCDLDVAVFCAVFAPALGVTCRFVGTEPHCAVTNAYNTRMRALLPACGVELREIARLEQGGQAVSASTVRQLLAERDWPALRALVPPATLKELERMRDEQLL